MGALPHNYVPAEHEQAVYERWEAAGAFTAASRSGQEGRQPFVIMLPLPNVTGSLHMGHALQHSLSDVLIRYHRMKGEPTLWQPGTDHAGIATQNVVERELRAEGKSRHDLGREAFEDRVWQWKERYGDIIVAQMKRLGASCDWSRLTFTMDPDYVRAVHEAFRRYWDGGYIYRGNRIVNWCPRCASVISDLEIKHEARTTQLYTLRYPVQSPAAINYIDVATTRLETMLGDTAVAVHPTDERYIALVGKTAVVPIVNRDIPIIADERVDATFGTGAVKVTPAHDQFDAMLAETHHLPTINVIGEDGRMTAAAGDFAGQTAAEGRAAVLTVLREQQALVKEESYRHEVALCERCGTVIEPLVSRQWFVDMSKLKDETIMVAEQDLITFVPPRWKKHFLTWMHEVRDWTISRQLWWGQQIPVWWKPGVRGTEAEDEPGSFVVAVEKPAGEWEHDPDVLDTWFSSAIWPLATLGWPEATPDLQTFYPTAVLVTARDIVYLWVARMIFSGLELLKGDEYGNRPAEARIPFHQVLIHPTVLTKAGQRMSKSLGTGIDPLGLIDQYGADATRFGLLYQLNFDAQALKFDEAGLKSARNFANKVWNLARLLTALEGNERPGLADEWIEAKLTAVTNEVTELLEQYRVGEAARVLYHFVWNDVADWYVEILKVEGSTAVATRVFVQALALLHPFMPHLTEVLWAHFGHAGLLVTSAWPTPEPAREFSPEMARFQEVVTTVRSLRTLLGIKPATVVDLYSERALPLLAALQKLARVQIVGEAAAQMKAFPLSSGGSVRVGGAAITDTALARARARLTKHRSQLEQVVANLTKTRQQMAGNAPPERVAQKDGEIAALQQRLADVTASEQLLR